MQRLPPAFKSPGHGLISIIVNLETNWTLLSKLFLFVKSLWKKELLVLVRLYGSVLFLDVRTIFDMSCHALMTEVRCEKMQKEFLHKPACGSDRPSWLLRYQLFLWGRSLLSAWQFLNKIVSKLNKDCLLIKHCIIDNVWSAYIIQLPIFSFLLFCYQNALVRSLLESRSRQCSLQPRVDPMVDQPGQTIGQPLTGQLIGWFWWQETIRGISFSRHRRLYFPTLDPTAVTCSLSVLNIE